MDTEKNDVGEVKVEDLIAVEEKLDWDLEKLDSKNTEHRQLAVLAIETYIQRYVIPALYLANTNIGKVVGKEIQGLGLYYLFDSNRKDLNRPSDEEIDDVLIGLAERTPTPQLREDFWNAWLVREALGCIKGLCNFLEEPLIPRMDKRIKPEVLKAEIRQLEYILSLPITDAFRQWIEDTIRAEKEALAVWNEEVTA